MVENNAILNRFFTYRILFDLIHGNDNSIYETVIKRYVSDPEDKDNGKIISEIYKFMSEKYRNEYFYQNTLLNKLLLEKHNVDTTTALRQLPIARSKADFVLINGKAVVYEIKTELDTLERLRMQLTDYYKAFDHVCVVTSENHYYQVLHILSNTPVGIYILAQGSTTSLIVKKEPTEYNTCLDHTTIFKLLRKREYENIVLEYYGKLPSTPQAFYYNECLRLFSNIPILEAYALTLKELKKRNKIMITKLDKVPYELKSLAYFSNFSESDWKKFNSFLSTRYGR